VYVIDMSEEQMNIKIVQTVDYTCGFATGWSPVQRALPSVLD
jgi:hypothetical protein